MPKEDESTKNIIFMLFVFFIVPVILYLLRKYNNKLETERRKAGNLTPQEIRFDEIVDHYSVSPPIVVEGLSKSARKLRWYLLSFILLAVVSFIIEFKIFSNNSIIMRVFELVGVLGFIIVIWKLSFTQADTDGSMTINTYRIKINKGEMNLNISMTEIKSITFTNGGYAGQRRGYNSFYSGDENFIEFVSGIQQYKFKINVENEEQQHYFRIWIEHCKKLGVDATYKEQN